MAVRTQADISYTNMIARLANTGTPVSLQSLCDGKTVILLVPEQQVTSDAAKQQCGRHATLRGCCRQSFAVALRLCSSSAGKAFRNRPGGVCDTGAFEACVMAYDAYTLKPETNSNKQL